MTMLAEAPVSAPAPAVAAENEATAEAEAADICREADEQLAEVAADLGLPTPEKVGSRTRSYDELLRHDERVRKAELEVAMCEREYEGLKEETAAAKKQFEKAVDRLRAVIRSTDPDADPLFNQPAAEAQDDTAAEDKPADPDAWRAVPLAEVLPDAKLAGPLLEAGVTTFGELEDWRATRGETPKVVGLGPVKRQAIDDAIVAWWTAHPTEKAAEVREAIEAVSPGSVESVAVLPNGDVSVTVNDAFTEDAVDYDTRETLTHIEGVMRIETARRTNGQYQSGYMLLLGKIDKSRPIGISPQYATREEAARDAIDAVGGAVAAANGELRGKAAKVAKQVRDALAAVAK